MEYKVKDLIEETNKIKDDLNYLLIEEKQTDFDEPRKIESVALEKFKFKLVTITSIDDIIKILTSICLYEKCNFIKLAIKYIFSSKYRAKVKAGFKEIINIVGNILKQSNHMERY